MKKNKIFFFSGNDHFSSELKILYGTMYDMLVKNITQVNLIFCMGTMQAKKQQSELKILYLTVQYRNRTDSHRLKHPFMTIFCNCRGETVRKLPTSCSLSKLGTCLSVSCDDPSTWDRICWHAGYGLKKHNYCDVVVNHYNHN